MVAGAAAAQDRVLWRNPGAVERIDFRYPAGGATYQPVRPYHFVSEDFTGSSPKVVIRDAASVNWRVKGGYEIKSESFATRLAAALGYYAESNCFVRKARIEGVPPLRRAAPFVHSDGWFVNAALERRDPELRFLAQDWAWNYNPFLGTRELQGLKVLMMLLSNWDNKDARDRAIGSNTGILEQRVKNRVQLIYFVNDWGQTLGAWGADYRPKGWDCTRFTAQTEGFVRGRDGDKIRFGFVGLHTDEFANDVRVEDARWLLGYLGRITNPQLRTGLRASGATAAECRCFTTALRKRINQLRRASRIPRASGR